MRASRGKRCMERKSRLLKRKGQRRIDGGYEVVEREVEGQRALHNFQLLSHTHAYMSTLLLVLF